MRKLAYVHVDHWRMGCPLTFQTWLNKKGEPDPPTLVRVFKDNEARGINYWPTDMQTGKSHCFCIHNSLSQQKHCSTPMNRLCNCHLCTKDVGQLIWICLLWLLLKVACSSSPMIGLNYTLIIHREACRISAQISPHALSFLKGFAWMLNGKCLACVCWSYLQT